MFQRLFYHSRRSLYVRTARFSNKFPVSFKWAVWSTALGGAGWYLQNQLYAEAPANSAVKKEPVSLVEYPTKLKLFYDDPTQAHELDLIGLGVRQVTFMYISVYTVGLYLDKACQDRLKLASRWTQEFKSDKIIKGSPESKWFLSDLLENGHGLALVLQNCRTTDAPHMRNGFVKFLTTRLSTCKASAEEKKVLQAAIDKIRAEFPSGTFKAGNKIVITRLPSGYLRFEFPDREKATPFVIENDTVSKWFFEGYMNVHQPISPPLMGSIANGLEQLLHPEL